MRNLFDQYSQTENRLTHALVWTLRSEPQIMGKFLKWLGIKNIPRPKTLQINEQHIPGSNDLGGEPETSGLPDAMIHDGNEWAVIFESKVEASPTKNQLERHRATASRHGFLDAPVVLITVEKPRRRLPEWAIVKEWKEVYAWFRKQQSRSPSQLLPLLTEYIEILESHASENSIQLKGTLTMFDGFHFSADHSYAYGEAKRQIRLFRAKLIIHPKLKALGIDSEASGRSAITGRSEGRIWDFIPLKQSRDRPHTAQPHLTIGVKSDCLIAAVTVPNSVKGGFRTRLKKMGPDQFIALIQEIEKNLRPITNGPGGAKPILYATQRHFKSQRSAPDVDGHLEVDIRTVVDNPKTAVKFQPQWAGAIYQVLISKRSNIQFGVEVRFQYEDPRVQSTAVLDLFANSWVAMWPVVRLVLPE